MARHKKGRRGTTRTTSILATLFAIVPPIYLLTNVPSGSSNSALGYLLGGGGDWTSLVNAASVLAKVVIQHWVTVLIILAVAFVAIKVVRKLGRGARISRHLTA